MAPGLLVTVEHPFPALTKTSPVAPPTPPDTPSDSSPLVRIRSWTSVSEDKKSERDGQLQAYGDWRLPVSVRADPRKNVTSLLLTKLTKRERDIVRLDATALVDHIRLRHYSSLEVTIAFCKSASAAQDLTNCLTEIFFGEALEQAEQLDRHLAETGRVVGPLHGLPVSVKDHILLKGKVK